MYILERLTGSHTEQMVIAKFGGDEQLVMIWIEFLQETRWMIKDSTHNRWMATDTGKLWINKYGGQQTVGSKKF